MDSEDSRDGSSGNESNDGGQSPVSTKSQAPSTKSNASHSRSSSPESRVQSAHSEDVSNIQEDTPHSPEYGNNFVEDSNHSKNGSHHSLDESEHSVNDSQHSQEDRFHSAVNHQSPEEKLSPKHGENSPINSLNSISEGPHSPEDTKNKTSSGHSQASRDSSPASQHSFNSSGSKRSLIEGENSEKDVKRRSTSPFTKNRSRSRSSSYLSDDNDDRNSKTSGNHIPKSPNSYRHSYPSSPNAKTSNNKSQSPDFSQSSSARKTTKLPEKALSDNDDDNESVKSGSSSSSISSKGSGKSLSSVDSRSVDSRRSTRSRKKSESSISSDSSRSSSHKKSAVKSSDTHAEEISDGDMESDQENDSQRFKEETRRPELNMSHEDLSDVSDLEGSIGENLENDPINEDGTKKDDESSEYKHLSPDSKQISVKNKGTEEGEEQLDFEAEDGECGEIEQVKEKDEPEEKSHTTEKEQEKPEENKEVKELEEGEVTDEDDVRPEEVEPRPVCRFFSRGQCTWGASCRFLHPGVTDKGNYTMFEMIRPVVPGEFGRDERIYAKPEPPLIESAWERGLRTAKEMLRKSVKRKEQDIDFEEKKMNLSLAQEEFDKENGYYGRVPSPEPRYVRHIPAEYPVARPPPEEYYGRRQIHYEPEYAPLPPRERVRPYRELPPHRMPDYYNNKYEEEPASSSIKRPKPKREVIVQRAEERQGRGDEWSDPWMRSKSPAGRRKERKRSYSSGSSYSSSSSSHSSSDSSRSTYRSRSISSHRRRRSRSRRSRQVSPSVIVSERKAANERAALMNPPAPKRRAPSPGMMRVTGAANPPAPSRDDLRRSRSKLAAALARVKGRRSSRSSSGSSGSSSSDTDSSDSSSTTSRDESSPRRPAGVELSIAKAMDALKSGGLEKNKIKLNLKNPVGMKKNETSDSRKPDQAQGKKRTATSPPAGDPKSKKATSRREELLKQLKAVEDAIAKKRSKVN